MKEIIYKTLLTTVIIAILVWLASMIFNFSYNNWSFFIGLGLSVVIFLMNSSGGALSKMADWEASKSMWKVQKENNDRINLGVIFYGSVTYTIVSLIIVFILYI